MTKYEVLNETLNMVKYNLHCYSKNYDSSPKEGFESEFLQEQQKAEIIRQMIDDLTAPKASVKLKIMRYELMKQHMNLVKSGKLYEASKILQFLNNRQIELNLLDDVDWEIELILLKIGFKIKKLTVDVANGCGSQSARVNDRYVVKQRIFK